jgi:hypothetical protein
MSLAHRREGGDRGFTALSWVPAFGQGSSCELCGDLARETVDCAPIAAVAFRGMDGLGDSSLGEPQPFALEAPGKYTMPQGSRQLHQLGDVRRLSCCDEFRRRTERTELNSHTGMAASDVPWCSAKWRAGFSQRLI